MVRDEASNSCLFSKREVELICYESNSNIMSKNRIFRFLNIFSIFFFLIQIELLFLRFFFFFF